MTNTESRREAVFDLEVITRRGFDVLGDLVVRSLIIVVDILFKPSALDENLDFQIRMRFGDRHLEDSGGVEPETNKKEGWC